MTSLCEVQNQPEMQHSLLSVLGNRDQNDVSRTLLGMSTSPDTCAAMRSSGCLPLIIRLLYAPDSSHDMKKHVALALHNIVNSNPNEAQAKLEGRVLSLLENVRQYCDSLLQQFKGTKGGSQEEDFGKTVATILRLSFDAEQRLAMSSLGGLHAIARLIQVLHEVYGGTETDIHCLMLKRYASMALTNLTSGHHANKVLLCSLKQFMHALVAQLSSASEELQQATSSVIRNLSWKADAVSKQILQETGAVSILMKMAMRVKKESTLQSILSALWNLSSNCSMNKIELCAVIGALGFLTDTLTYKAPSQKLRVIEIAGGVLRNVSSHVAERDDYRAILREHDCLQILTQQLTSLSTRIVGNACITLWNLSSDCAEDQYTLWMLGAPNLLRNLVHSKHKLIALGSSAALKNLLSGRPESDNLFSLLLGVPATGASGETNHRRSKTVEEELNEVLSESRMKSEAHVALSLVTGRRDDKFVFSLTDVEKKRQQRRTVHKSHTLSRSGSKEYLSSALLDGTSDGVIRITNGDRKLSSSSDNISLDSDSLKSWNETTEEKSKPTGKYACVVMKDDTEDDLNCENEAISTVEELLEVIKDMESLRLTEDSSNKERKNKTSEESGIHKISDVSTTEERISCEESVPVIKQEPEEQTKEEDGATSEDSSANKEPKTSPEELPSLNEESLRSPEASSFDAVTTEDFSVAKKTLTAPEELQRSLEDSSADVTGQSPTYPEELSCDKITTVAKNISLVSPRSLEKSPSDLTHEAKEESSKSPEEFLSIKVKEEPLTPEESHSDELKNELASPERSLEELPSDEVKKEVTSPERLQRSLEELTFDEEVKEELLEEGRNSPEYSLDADDSCQQPERPATPEEFGDYAETDLDQPTDYSLQYGEEDELTDEDAIHPNAKRDAAFYVTGVPISIHEDTVKTYCTEGTPFETPYNFSTATSMSDLRAEPSIKEEMDENESETASVDQKEAAGDRSSVQVKAESVDVALLDRFHSMDSGLLSPPDKPVEFCEEGTPGRISRFSSLSSLCGDVSHVERTPHKSISEGSGSPYMNGGDERSYQDMPSHSNNSSALDDSFSAAGKSDNINSDNAQPKIVRASVFEDAVVSFKDETTPINFSCATSLSSLSFDDEPKIQIDMSLKQGAATKRVPDLPPQTSHIIENGRTNLGLPPFHSHQQRRKDGFSVENPIPGSCKSGSTGVRSPRVSIKQENEPHLSNSNRSNGEDDACEDSTYRFCTEGTPANISHAGSHSDLSSLSIPPHRTGTLTDKNSVIDESDDNLSFSDDGDNILAECIKSGMPKMLGDQRNGGIQNKQMKVDDGNGSNDRGNCVAKEEEDGGCDQTDNAKQRDDIGDRGKVVTFDNADHYAEETPLMFSRASSLASLSSFDQQSIVDDRSSVISDLSRLTSGAVSPSEIPDSSAQLVSASPHQFKASPEFPTSDAVERNAKTSFAVLPQPTSHQSFNKTEQICVFEDDVKPFKVEDTPIEFSRATSLSSLSICDDANPAEEAPALTKEERERDSPKEEDDKDKSDDKSDKNSINLESEGEEDDEILAACISIGMQQSRKTQDSNQRMFNNFEARTHFSSTVNHSNHPRLSPVKTERILSPKPNQLSNAKFPGRCSEPVQASAAFDDVTHGYFTEDTPANISHAASHSDLSVLSFRSGKDEAHGEDSPRMRTTTELSDDLFNVSDNEGMLAECIQAGMPKKSTTKKRNNSLSLYPEKEVNGNFSPRHHSCDRNGLEAFHDRPRSSASSQQLSPVLHKSKPSSRPMSANSHVSSLATKSSSHSRKSRRALPSAEPRRVEGFGAFDDSICRFYTEDTPASISHAGSNSDISVLSIPDDDREFHQDFHRRQASFHNLSDDSFDDSDNENILAECIQSGMPKAKISLKTSHKPTHSHAPGSHAIPHHQMDPNLNFSRRSFNPVPQQQFRHASRSTSRTSRNVGFIRRSLSQSDRPQNYPVNVNHGFVVPQQSFVNDAILNRNLAATGMWPIATTHKMPFNSNKDMLNSRTPPNCPNSNSYTYDSGWEMDASILKDSQALRSMLQNHQNLRWLRKFRSTSPNNRRHENLPGSSNTFYSRENMSSSSHNSGELAASAKGPMQTTPQPSPCPIIRPFDRQRTFTKLEPTVHAHLPSPSSKTKIPVPAQPPIKLPEKTSTSKKAEPVAKGRLKSKTTTNQPMKKSDDRTFDRTKTSRSSNGYTSSTSKTPSGTWSGKSTPTLRSNGPASSSSSTSSLVFKQNTAERRSFRVPKTTGLEDKRSNSFSSITSSASSKSSVRPFKREVTSKVASLWKRTDTSSDDGHGKSNVRNDVKSENDKRVPAARKMVRSATFEGLPRNLELAKPDKIKDDSQVRPNHMDRSKRVSHKSRYCVDKKEEGKTQYDKSAENLRNNACAVITRRDRAMSLKKADQSSVRVTKV